MIHVLSYLGEIIDSVGHGIPKKLDDVNNCLESEYRDFPGDQIVIAKGRLRFGVVNKLFMKMDDLEQFFPFLQMALDQAELSTRHAAKIPQWMRRTHSNCPIYGRSRVLLAWLGGEEGMELELLSEEEIIRGAHAMLDAFPPAIHPWSARMKRCGWAKDPLFLGPCNYVAIGSSGDDLNLMAEPLPKNR
uniref:Polyamine oxidase 1-like n=1 Tax=Elaeis guineensis var. tenera TaxID=51953 RepID=A0A8N4FAU6_ELAGV|nr:polyamine oxidase 1-like [Elaeis guineensis]